MPNGTRKPKLNQDKRVSMREAIQDCVKPGCDLYIEGFTHLISFAAAHEIMVGTPAIRNLIRENKIAQMYSAIQTGEQFGMQTLDQNLQELVKKGIVSSAEARSKAANKDNFPG